MLAIVNNKDQMFMRYILKKSVYLTIVIILINLLQTDIVLSKCLNKTFTVKGKIKYHSKSGDVLPLSKAIIIIFFDDFDYGYSDYSTEKGNFTIRYIYDTYSGWFLSDLCGKKPKAITAVIKAEGFLTKKYSYRINNVEVFNNENLYKLPTITLDWAHPSILNP